MTTQTAIAAKSEMLIRRPVADVFEAFVDPKRTSQFWFTGGTGRLERGKRVQWTWDMYDLTVNVEVKALEENKRIFIDWWSGNAAPTSVEWQFTPRSAGTTYVKVSNFGFRGDEDEIVNQAITSTEGFTYVLAGLKAFLEHDVRLNLIADRHPDGLGQ
jgi:uncharacterized protein YndB with AHSA1/START domain